MDRYVLRAIRIIIIVLVGYVMFVMGLLTLGLLLMALVLPEDMLDKAMFFLTAFMTITGIVSLIIAIVTLMLAILNIIQQSGSGRGGVTYSQGD